MRMSHPVTKAVIDVPDVESTIAVHRDAGWVEEPEPVQHHPALVAGELPPEPEHEPEKPASKKPKPEGEGA